MKRLAIRVDCLIAFAPQFITLFYRLGLRFCFSFYSRRVGAVPVCSKFMTLGSVSTLLMLLCQIFPPKKIQSHTQILIRLTTTYFSSHAHGSFYFWFIALLIWFWNSLYPRVFGTPFLEHDPSKTVVGTGTLEMMTAPCDLHSRARSWDEQESRPKRRERSQSSGQKTSLAFLAAAGNGWQRASAVWPQAHGNGVTNPGLKVTRSGDVFALFNVPISICYKRAINNILQTCPMFHA